MDSIGVAAEFKFADAEATARGEFTGYASVFGNMDLGGDIVEAGAFKETLAKRGSGGVAMLWGHDMRSPPIGKWLDLQEDDRGLVARGQLILDVAKARDVHALMREGALKGLSIGYRIPPGGAEMDRRGARRIKAADVHEISVVTFPMNQRAQVSRVKSADALTITEIKEIEDLLRDAGASGAERKRAVAVFKKWLQRDAEGPNDGASDEVIAAELAGLIRRNVNILAAKG